MRIDSHQHFWKYDPIDYDWINDEMAVIRKDFFPGDLEPLLKQNGFDGCVAVQAHQSEQETEQLLNYADQYKFVKGVVGWVDLQADNIEARLAHYQQFEKLKGLRHVLQGEPQRDLMLQPRFKKGISLLSKFGFTYDILIFPDQLRFAKELVKEFSQQAFVIDHIAKPYIKDKKTKNRCEGWPPPAITGETHYGVIRTVVLQSGNIILKFSFSYEWIYKLRLGYFCFAFAVCFSWRSEHTGRRSIRGWYWQCFQCVEAGP